MLWMRTVIVSTSCSETSCICIFPLVDVHHVFYLFIYLLTYSWNSVGPRLYALEHAVLCTCLLMLQQPCCSLKDSVFLQESDEIRMSIRGEWVRKIPTIQANIMKFCIS